MTAEMSNQTGVVDEAGRVLALLQKQRDLYRELKSHGDRQSELIALGQTDRLLALLGTRQALIDGLGKVSALLAPYRSRIALIADQAAGGDGQQMRSLIEEVRELLESIMAQDEQSKSQLVASRNKMANQVRQVSDAASAAGAYGGQSGVPSPSTFTQRKG